MPCMPADHRCWLHARRVQAVSTVEMTVASNTSDRLQFGWLPLLPQSESVHLSLTGDATISIDAPFAEANIGPPELWIAVTVHADDTHAADALAPFAEAMDTLG